MNHKLTYLAVLAMFAASCSSDDVGVDNIYTLSEDGSKTPIAIETNLSAAPKTRAFDKTFESGDELLAYIEAGKMVDGTFSSDGNPFKGLKTLTLTANANNNDGDNHKDLYGYKVLPDGVHITETEDAGLQTLYWDDYSSTSNDLRASGAGIRLKYGYCYNGGTPSTALVEATGILGWTVLLDQSAADGSGMKHSDLLYAATQAPVSYIHGETQTSKHGVLVLPYAHAMSKITINITAREGFSSEKANFGSALVLKNMQTKATINAPAGTVTASTDATDVKEITTFTKSTANKEATYQAIIGPTNLSVTNNLASITIDGTNYDIPLTEAILSAWSAENKLIESDEVIYHSYAQAKPLTRDIYAGTGYITKPGIHYILNVKVDKQKITLRATIIDWDKVEADGKGEIKFNADVKTIDKDNSITSGSFDIFHAKTTDALTKTTTATYTDGKWVNSPNIYWENGSTNYYFRGLAKYDGTKPSSVNGSLDTTQGTDLIWATTAAHKGIEVNGTSHDYAEGAAINPRTGDIPMQFYHAMSKLTMNLETTSDASKVDLEGAKISISNLSTTGTIAIADGTITKGDNVENAIDKMSANISNYPVIPQGLTDASIITITLADGTTYKLKLTDCKVTGSEEHVTAWTRGKHYTYTIHLEKEKITFRALVKDWEGATGSGNATLEWD